MAFSPDFNSQIIHSDASITDMVAFHDALRDIEASDTGLLYPVIHTYKEVQLGGGAIFPAIAFINGWTIQFPAGAWMIAGGNLSANINPVAGCYVRQTQSAAYAVSSALGGGLTEDPWEKPLPGGYSTGTAGYILGTNLDKQVSDIEMVAVGAALNKRATGSEVIAGTVIAGDYLSTWNMDGFPYTLIDDAGELDVILNFNVGEGSIPTGAELTGGVTSKNDSVNVYVWNWELEQWGYFENLGGKDTNTYRTIPLTLFVTNVGPGGDVRIRFHNTGLTTATLYLRLAYVTYSPQPSGLQNDERVQLMTLPKLVDIENSAALAKQSELVRALGLMQENYALDECEYDGDGLMTSGRVRIYSNAASVGMDEDVLASYRVTSVWVVGRLTDYKVMRI